MGHKQIWIVRYVKFYPLLQIHCVFQRFAPIVTEEKQALRVNEHKKICFVVIELSDIRLFVERTEAAKSKKALITFFSR